MDELAQLSGAKYAVQFVHREHARRAAQHLLVCHAHHFAMVGEQQVVVLSEMAVGCLENAGLMPAVGHGMFYRHGVRE
jgi:hypothetical protein